VADSNGLFHGLGDHAENSFSWTASRSRTSRAKSFSNQIPLDSIQSLEAVSGGPPAEYGGKTSLVIKVTTQSGLGVTKPKVLCIPPTAASARSGGGFRLAFGGQKWGNFIAAKRIEQQAGFSTLRTSRHP